MTDEMEAAQALAGLALTEDSGEGHAESDKMDAIRGSVLSGHAEKYLVVFREQAGTDDSVAAAGTRAPLVFLMDWFHSWQQEYEVFVHVLEGEEANGSDDENATEEKDLEELEAEAEGILVGFGAIAIKLLELLAIDKPDEVVDRHGWTLLMQAANSGLRTLVDVLVEMQVDVNHTGKAKDGVNPLYLAVSSDHTAEAMVLLKNGAHLSMTAVVTTPKEPHGDSDDEGDDDREDSATDQDCAWLQACRMGQSSVIEEMLALGIDINYAIPSTGDCALHVAVMFEMQDVVELLVANDSLTLNATNHSGQTCLFGCSNLELAQFLVKQGVQPGTVDVEGETAYTVALELGDDDVAAYLKSVE